MLVLAAFTISLIILSTQVYVYQLSRREAYAGWSTLSDHVLNIEQGSRHVVVASLINVSQGGAASPLRSNLDQWEAFAGSDYQFGACNLNATVTSQATYSDGVWLEWGTEGRGVSSASADFALNISGRGVEVDWSYAVNITTAVLVSGNYVEVGSMGLSKQVTIVINLLNEEEPALAGAISLDYFNGSWWKNPADLSSYSWRDFGNGTCLCSFTDIIVQTPVQVLVQAYDRRGILVQAEASLGEG